MLGNNKWFWSKQRINKGTYYTLTTHWSELPQTHAHLKTSDDAKSIQGHGKVFEVVHDWKQHLAACRPAFNSPSLKEENLQNKFGV